VKSPPTILNKIDLEEERWKTPFNEMPSTSAK